MHSPVAARLPRDRLHLQHGPIDLVLTVEGAREAAFDAAIRRFATILEELVAELPHLRRPLGSHAFEGDVARRMESAVRPFAGLFVTPMAAVAGAVADEILAAMLSAADVSRAAVNNGGDIAFYLAPDHRFDLAISAHTGRELGRVEIDAAQAIGGIATSGRHGRSLSMGIADSVTALARTAAAADAAATLIASAVDLPGHPGVQRKPANTLDPDSDLGDRLVTTGCERLCARDTAAALNHGAALAQQMIDDDVIRGAALFLQSDARLLGTGTRQTGAVERR